MDQTLTHSTPSTAAIARAYSSPPWWYDLRGFLILTFSYVRTLWSQVGFFGRNLGARHLEVACGTGTLLALVLAWRRLLGRPRGHVVGVDYAPAMLAGAQRRFAGDVAIELRQADAAALPYPDASFDTANIANAVHCFPDVDGALRDVHRVLQPGGVLAANVLLQPRVIQPLRAIAVRINRWGMRKGILHTPYDRAEIRARFVAAGFELVAEEVAGNCLDLVARKPAA